MNKTNNITDYICDDREIPIPQEILNMTDEEIEAEYKKRFWRVTSKEPIAPNNGDNEYMIDDREVDVDKVLEGMTEEEIETEFKRLYGQYL